MLTNVFRSTRGHRMTAPRSAPPPSPSQPPGTPQPHQETLPLEVTRAEATARGEGTPRIPGYEILGEIGQGGFGRVYRARHVALGREAAIKALRPEKGQSPLPAQRFANEAQALGRLRHPHVVEVYDSGFDLDGAPYLALEYMDRGSLRERLLAGPVSLVEAVEIVRQLAEALDYVHGKQVLHRDLKPENVLRAADGVWKVADFGLARLTDADHRLTVSCQVMGTVLYASPEQLRGDVARIDARTDVYSLGALFYELLVGRTPHHGTTLHEVLAKVLNEPPKPLRAARPGTPRALAAICMKCLEKRPRDRFRSARELADELGRWQRGEPVRTGAGYWWRSAWNRHGARLRAAACGLAAAAAGYVVLCDAGFALPAGEAIRAGLDRADWSWFRPVASREEVFAEAAAMRGRVLDQFRAGHQPDGWWTVSLDPAGGAPRETWTHGEMLYGVVRSGDTRWTDEELLAALDAPFDGPDSVWVNDQFHGWAAHPHDVSAASDQLQADPALWMLASAAALRGQTTNHDPALRARLDARIEQLQTVLDAFGPVADGGWAMFPRQRGEDVSQPYTTALAVLALVELRQAKAGWHGSPERLDEMLERGCAWLADRVQPGNTAYATGWRISGRVEKFSSSQASFIYTVLLRAERDAGRPLPATIEAGLIDHLSRLRRGDDQLEFSGRYLDPRSGERLGAESLTVLWYPWAISCTTLWRDRQAERGATPDELRPLDRLLGELIVAEGPAATEATLTTGQKAWEAFRAADLLITCCEVRDPNAFAVQRDRNSNRPEPRRRTP